MKQNRVRRCNDKPLDKSADYVLYWMQMYRRLEHNHALDYAARCARELGKPLVIYEALRLDYPWANARLHSFALQGMRDNAARAKAMGANYWPFVESPDRPARGVVRQLVSRAALVVTDDYPCFIVPEHTAALAKFSPVGVFAIDGNSMVPLSMLGAPIVAAAHLRPRIHKAFAAAWEHRSAAAPELATARVDPPFEPWSTDDLGAFVAALPIDQSVPPVPRLPGGRTAALAVLDAFIAKRLHRYADDRSEPASPDVTASSGLSPYLHFGHIGIEEVVERVLAQAPDFDPSALAERKGGKRDGFYCGSPHINGFLDEAITWRDVGFQWHYHRRRDAAALSTALPPWAWKSLQEHSADPRQYEYELGEFEAAATHDPLWNAAQRELVRTGTMHNYMRMLWGKKVLEWSKTPDGAYAVLEHLNNKYAIDGRDPNSYTGILWCFGGFDRPWAPERKIFGVVRYMSSDNTAKKFNVKPYLAYVQGLR